MANHLINSGEPIKNGVTVVAPENGVYNTNAQEVSVTNPFLFNLAAKYKGGDWAAGVEMASENDTNSPASDNEAAVVQYAAESGVAHCVYGLSFAYDSVPSGGLLQVESPSGTVIVGPHPVTQAGPGFIPFPGGKCGPTNADMIVRLGAGGAGVKGSITTLGYRKA